MSETKLFEELLCLHIFQEEGEGGLPNSKVVEELFCLILDIYQEGGALVYGCIYQCSSTTKNFLQLDEETL